jgi:hypothetical protein
MDTDELNYNIREFANYNGLDVSKCRAIPKSELVVGETYKGVCRNAEEAVWKGDVFEYMRYKFGTTYPEEINHYEDDDGYDVFVPCEEI